MILLPYRRGGDVGAAYTGAEGNSARIYRATSLISASDPRPVTVSMWLKLRATSKLGFVWTNSANTHPAFAVLVDGSGVMKVFSGAYSTGSSARARDNRWHLYTWTWAADNTLTYYRDLEQLGSTSLAAGGTATSGSGFNDLSSAGFDPSSWGFDGAIAEFGCWASVLSEGDVAALWAGEPIENVSRASLRARLPFYHAGQAVGHVVADWQQTATVAPPETYDVRQSQRIWVPSLFATGQRVHYVIYLATETRIPSQEDIIKGWPGVAVVSDYQSSTQTEALSFYVEAEGLTANTAYKIAFVWYDGVNVSNYTIADFNTAVGSSDVNLTVGGNVSDSTSGTGSATQVHVLVGDTPTQASTSSTGAVNTGVTLTAGADSAANNSSTDSITQVHITTVGTDSSANTSSTVVITQVHLIVGDNSSSSSTSSTASITQIQVLATGSDTAANISSTASISQVHVVTVGSDSTATSSSTDVVTQIQILTTGSDTQAASVPGVTIGSSGNYTGDACAQASTSGTGGITQIHVISVASSSQGNTSSSGSIGSSIDLTIASSDSVANSSTASISQVHNIAGTSDSVSSSSGVGAITQVQILVADTDSSTNTSSAVNVQQIQQLVVSGSTSSTASTSVFVEQLHNITVSYASQAASGSSAAISQVHTLVVIGSDTQISYSSAVSLMSSYQELSSTYVRESSNERFVVEVIPTTFILDTNTGKYGADKVMVRIKA